MHCSLEIHLERKIFQYSMNFTLSFGRLMFITQENEQANQMLVVHHHKFKLPTNRGILNILLNQD